MNKYIQHYIKKIKTFFYTLVVGNLTTIDFMKTIEQHKKERKESYQLFLIKTTNLNYLGPVLIFSVLSLFFAWATIELSADDNRIAAWVTTLLTGLSVRFLTNKLIKLGDKEKLENKGLTAVRNLDSILLSLLKIKERARVEDVDYIEEQIINSIEDWEDILPDLKFRDRVNKAKDFNRKIQELEQSNEDKGSEIKELKSKLELLMNNSRDIHLNSVPTYSGGTASNY